MKTGSEKKRACPCIAHQIIHRILTAQEAHSVVIPLESFVALEKFYFSMCGRYEAGLTHRYPVPLISSSSTIEELSEYLQYKKSMGRHTLNFILQLLTAQQKNTESAQNAASLGIIYYLHARELFSEYGENRELSEEIHARNAWLVHEWLSGAHTFLLQAYNWPDGLDEIKRSFVRSILEHVNYLKNTKGT